MQLKTGRVLLYSGGMDSYVLGHLNEYDTCLYIRTESAYDNAQLFRIAKNPPKNFKIDARLKLSDCQLDNDPTATVPARNLLFITIASYYGNVIHFGATKGSKHADKDPDFVRKTQELLNHIYRPHDRKIVVQAPLGNLTKHEIVSLWRNSGKTVQELFDNSFTCYTPTEYNTECGTCVACQKKLKAFQELL